MAQYLSFAIIGLAFGCLYAAIGMGVVVTYRGAGVINFATGAIAMRGRTSTRCYARQAISICPSP